MRLLRASYSPSNRVSPPCEHARFYCLGIYNDTRPSKVLKNTDAVRIQFSNSFSYVNCFKNLKQKKNKVVQQTGYKPLPPAGGGGQTDSIPYITHTWDTH